jgi:hypothetical protein
MTSTIGSSFAFKAYDFGTTLKLAVHFYERATHVAKKNSLIETCSTEQSNQDDDYSKIKNFVHLIHYFIDFIIT